MQERGEMGARGGGRDLEKGLLIVPCLNEAAHIAALVEAFRPSVERLDLTMVIADGGSTDGTREILHDLGAGDHRLVLLDNPQRIQSAAVNLAVARCGAGCDYFIRVDAHGCYPEDYCDRIVEEARRTGADSVVVAMSAVGDPPFQQAAALAQNSKLGNGGSKHRTGASGHWADHGHHALMRLDAFRSVRGYDESFSHNEDAELDCRLGKAGYRIWMTAGTIMTYYPRTTPRGLFRQYLGYGRGRAKNYLKHRTRLKIRQLLPLAAVPLVLLAVAAVAAGLAAIPAHLRWSAGGPFLIWSAVCFVYGLVLGAGKSIRSAPLVGFAAMIIHFAWSAGFWLELLSHWRPAKGGPVLEGRLP